MNRDLISPEKINKYIEEGILTVEMEASALFQAAKYPRNRLCNHLDCKRYAHGCRRYPEFHNKKVYKSIKKTYKITESRF